MPTRCISIAASFVPSTPDANQLTFDARSSANARSYDRISHRTHRIQDVQGIMPSATHNGSP